VGVVQRHFREIFTEWGLPGMLRVDNGAPWGTPGDLPPVLALWIIGLGVEMHWNRPHSPQENGVVERTHGVTLNWAEPQQCRSVRQLQARVDHEDVVQREKYPSIKGQSRMIAYPELQHSGRVYTVNREPRRWDWERVLRQLSEYVVSRQVDCSGKIGHYGGKLYVGVMHKGTQVYVQFDPDQVAWIICAADGRLLQSIATGWTPHAVRTLKIQQCPCR
jgi:hypothetical protein